MTSFLPCELGIDWLLQRERFPHIYSPRYSLLMASSSVEPEPKFFCARKAVSAPRHMHCVDIGCLDLSFWTFISSFSLHFSRHLSLLLLLSLPASHVARVACWPIPHLWSQLASPGRGANNSISFIGQFFVLNDIMLLLSLLVLLHHEFSQWGIDLGQRTELRTPRSILRDTLLTESSTRKERISLH